MKPTTFRVHAPILLDALAEPGGDGMYPLRIPTIRKATFVAGRYGPLEFDQPFIDSILRNFRNNVLGVEVSVDASHRPDLGALAWVQDLELEGDQMAAMTLATPDGAKLVRNKTYKYASAEIDPNYVDRETGEEYGPTLIGIALTNRPYVHRQGEVTLLSLDDNTYRVMESDQADVQLDWTDAARNAAAKVRELNRKQNGRLTSAVRRAIEKNKGLLKHYKARSDFARQQALKILGRTPSLNNGSRTVTDTTRIGSAAIRAVQKSVPKVPSVSMGRLRSTPAANVGSAAIRAIKKAKTGMPSRTAPIRKALKRQFVPIKGQ